MKIHTGSKKATQQYVITFLLLLFSMHFPSAYPMTTIKSTSYSHKKTAELKTFIAASTKKKKKTDSVVAIIDEDDIVPDILSSKTLSYHCELNDTLTMYTNINDDKHAAIRWKNRLYRLKRIATTTGANRFENKKAGLVWIGIPAKGMLLNSRLGQQLANECKTQDQ